MDLPVSLECWQGSHNVLLDLIVYMENLKYNTHPGISSFNKSIYKNTLRIPVEILTRVVKIIML